MNTSSSIEIYTRITALLAQKGMSGTELAPILGLKKSPLTDWKNEKSAPTLEHIITICDFFGVSADYIIWGKNVDDLLFNNSSPAPTPLISHRDQELLTYFHKLDDLQQERCIGYVEGLADKSQNKKISPAK